MNFPKKLSSFQKKFYLEVCINNYLGIENVWFILMQNMNNGNGLFASKNME